METVFLHLLNMSITAGWIALAVIILRLFLKKAPRWITVLLWGLVGLRLLLPVSIESVLSLIPSAETVPPEIIYAQEPVIHSGVDVFNSAVNPVISESLAPVAGASVNPVQIILFIATVVWLVGLTGMLLYTLISYLRLRHKVKVSMSIDKNIYICDSINTPFILGVLRPKIYLPSTLTSEEQEYVLSHEKAHLKRRDHLIKPLGFLLLSVYWFNPLLWIAYILLCRDIEIACDEKVIKNMDTEDRKEYSTALLNCSIPRRMISACPLAFGEVSVKQRIKGVLNYKKPAFWISIVAIILCIALSVGFLTNPVDRDPYGVKVVNTGSDIEGVSLELVELELNEDLNDNPYIEVKWNNKNNESYTCGEDFYIYKYVDGEWVNIRRGDYAFVTIGYTIPKNGTFKHTYKLWNIEIDEVGTYRFESTYLRDKGDTNPTQYKAWIDFEVTKLPDFEDNSYKVNSSNSSREGISAQITDLNLTANKPYIEVMWINENDHDITCGEYFYIYKLAKGEWLDCRIGEAVFDDIAYIIPANGTFAHKYSLKDIDMTLPGTYRFESTFSSKGEKVWIEFQYPFVSTAVTNTETGSNPKGITGKVLEISKYDKADGNTFMSENNIYVLWENHTEDTFLTMSSDYRLYRETTDPNKSSEWTQISAGIEDYADYTYIDMAQLSPNSSIKITYPWVNNDGEYRLEADFTSSKDNSICTAFIEFKAGSTTSSGIYENFETQDVANYYCMNAQEVVKPQLTLYRRTKEFRFMLSSLSSYLPTGTYSTEGNILTLTDDYGNKYVFEVRNASTLVFLGDKSAILPKYKYASNEEPRYPFNDKDLFTLKADDTTDLYSQFTKIEDDDYYDVSHYFDRMDFDIDGDGIVEEVYLCPGFTSGVFSFRIIAKANDETKYYSTYIGDHLDFSFKKDEKGKVYLLGAREEFVSADGRTLLEAESHKFDIRVKDGHILLTENGLPYGHELQYGNSKKIAELIQKYIKAYKTQDVELFNSCFKEEMRINPTDTEAINALINCVEDCNLDYIMYKITTEEKVVVTVVYEIVYNDDYIPVGNRDTGINHITCDFTIEKIDGKYLITEISAEEVEHY